MHSARMASRTRSASPGEDRRARAVRNRASVLGIVGVFSVLGPANAVLGSDENALLQPRA